MTKNVNADKYKYQGRHGIGFDLTGTFTHPDGGMRKNFIIFRCLSFRSSPYTKYR